MRLMYRKLEQNARVLQSRHDSHATGGLDDETNAAELAK